MLLVLEQHPELDIRMLFQKDNLINKGSSTRYSDWAVAHGVRYQLVNYGGEEAWINL